MKREITKDEIMAQARRNAAGADGTKPDDTDVEDALYDMFELVGTDDGWELLEANVEIDGRTWRFGHKGNREDLFEFLSDPVSAVSVKPAETTVVVWEPTAKLDQVWG